MTNQLRDFVDIAKPQGLRMELYVRQGTILSKNIDPYIIIKYFTWWGKTMKKQEIAFIGTELYKETQERKKNGS